MVTLLIDEQKVDLHNENDLYISLAVSSITEIDTSSMGYSKTIVVPMTLNNRKIIGDCSHINSIAMYNQQSHTARITVDGFTVIDGQVMLRYCKETLNGGEYEINIIGASKLWVSQANENMFNEIGVDFSSVISESMIMSSWTWDLPVRMLPVQRDENFIDNVNQQAIVPIRILSSRDYHPFLHVATLFRTIIESAGYNLISDFVDSEYFDSLYVSGAYPTRVVELLIAKMDFLAGRFADKSATANNLGRVVANPSEALSSVGNIVDTADPTELSDGDSGTTIEGVYTVNNCFQKVQDTIVFVVSEAVEVAFQLDLKYKTEYKMLSRDELKGFNKIYIDDQQSHEFKLSNTFVDRRENILPGYEYMVMVFNHTDGDTYGLFYKQLVNPDADLDNLQASDYTEVFYGSFSSRTQNVVLGNLGSVYSIIEVSLREQTSTGTYTDYEDDWAMYDGTVVENGTVEVEVQVTSSPERILPSEPKYFNNIFFGGAESGMTFTLDKATTLKPVFSPHPGIGTSIGFDDVAAHEQKQLTFINGIKHLFDLCFYTDSINKEVYVEPRSNFFDHSVIVDWSDKVDYDKAIEITELGEDLNSILTLGYQDGDGAIADWNYTYKEKFAEWSGSILNKFAIDGENNYTNPMFTPSITLNNVYSIASDAYFLQVGDRDDDTSSSEDLNFTAKIVRYLGMQDLPDGQSWGWPSYAQQYPCVVFHCPEKLDTTLCFDDRDDSPGLHSYYDQTIDIYNNSRRVSLYLKLDPKDIEPLIVLNSKKRDFRALYKLNIGNEDALFYLEQVCDYNPESSDSTQCIFIKKI